MVKDVLRYVKNTPNLKAFTGFSMIPYDVGVAIYTFEGGGMVLPMELVVDQKHKFGQILGLTMFIIALTSSAFGILGYYAFGSETRDIITSNMGKIWVTFIIQLAMCLNLFFAFPLMMNPVHEVVGSRCNGGWYSFLLRYVSVFLAIKKNTIFVFSPHIMHKEDKLSVTIEEIDSTGHRFCSKYKFGAKS